MADQRRMLSSNVVGSDAFMELSDCQHRLYVQLNMHADDDGFISNAKMIQRQNNTPPGTIEGLVEKKFLIQFDGIFVVKHWRINNQIRKDRYNETKYIELKKRLFIRPNGAYSLNPEGAIPVPQGHFTATYIEEVMNDDQLATGGQPREGERRGDKRREEKWDFKKPALSDIITYCEKKKYKVNAKKFFAHYQSNGWKVGQVPMKDWKASVDSWENNEYDNRERGGSKPANVLTGNNDNLARLKARVNRKS